MTIGEAVAYYRRKQGVVQAVQYDGTLASIEPLHIPEATQWFASSDIELKTPAGKVAAKPGDKTIAFGSAYPHPIQLACLAHKFKRLAVCFDNDFWGHYGTYVVSKLLKAPAYFPDLKDPACYVEANTRPVLSYIRPSDLKDMLIDEIAEYNALVGSGHELVRPLPYN